MHYRTNIILLLHILHQVLSVHEPSSVRHIYLHFYHPIPQSSLVTVVTFDVADHGNRMFIPRMCVLFFRHHRAGPSFHSGNKSMFLTPEKSELARKSINKLSSLQQLMIFYQKCIYTIPFDQTGKLIPSDELFPFYALHLFLHSIRICCLSAIHLT